MAVYQQGDTVRIFGAFTDLSDAPADPDTVTLRVLPPTGVVVSYTLPDVVKDTTGEYHYDLPLTVSGYWLYRWVGTGAVAAATEDRLIRVQATALA